MASSPAVPRTTTVRPEIQALRAVAVAAVVLHHGWPAVAPAGYMGVDVFFVVSGYLITALLLREVHRTGGISLRQFYVRRARRILPAAMAVLLAVSAATLAFAPYRDWAAYFREIVASAFYVENWRLAADSQTPASADLESTPVQHFWSLSVEEQFYLAWPLLILLALWVFHRRGVPLRRVLWAVLGSVSVLSFAWSLVLTADDHNLAYFSTLSRAWEFGVGGLLALLTATVPRAAAVHLKVARSWASWAGLALIAVPIVTFHDTEAFPGLWVLLPVVGTLAIIWAGMPDLPWSTARLAGLRPVQWVGDISYSLYLWHWPIFMFVPMITGVPSPPALMVVLVAVALGVSALSKRFIEDPFRRRVGPVGSHPRVLAGALAFTLAGVVALGSVAPGIAADELVCRKHGTER
ncbi:acyltransferase family protein [Agromyces sp. NPDC058110]|uniref:acyltransferase family protein n=1 Tax=Agromyces sp. NPDC058110 TaxID=3346345 RepID=UPI0036D9B468